MVSISLYHDPCQPAIITRSGIHSKYDVWLLTSRKRCNSYYIIFCCCGCCWCWLGCLCGKIRTSPGGMSGGIHFLILPIFISSCLLILLAAEGMQEMPADASCLQLLHQLFIRLSRVSVAHYFSSWTDLCSLLTAIQCLHHTDLRLLHFFKLRLSSTSTFNCQQRNLGGFIKIIKNEKAGCYR